MIVYLITDCTNGKGYVGQTRRTLEARFAQHHKVMGRGNACRALSDAMVAHGPEAFSIRILEECATQEQLDTTEIAWIARLGTMVPGGYNLTLGGGGKFGYKHTQESRRKMSSWQIGKRLSAEHKAEEALAKAKKGLLH